MRKVIVKIAVVMILIAFIYPIKSQAGLQANKNGTSLTTRTSGIYPNQLFIGIRNMEAYYGTLGKNAIIDTTTYLENGAEEGKGNGLDCHMAKNTEWGTIAILSASSYGEAPVGYSEASTTGNESGVFQMANGTGVTGNSKGYEYVAGILSGSTGNQYIKTIASADERYYDLYSSTITSRPGDATIETQNWKDSDGPRNSLDSKHPIFVREYPKGLFGFSHHPGYYISGMGDSTYVGSRAVVVFGDGI